MTEPNDNLQSFRDAWREELTKKPNSNPRKDRHTQSAQSETLESTQSLKNDELNESALYNEGISGLFSYSESESPFAFQVADNLLKNWHVTPEDRNNAPTSSKKRKLTCPDSPATSCKVSETRETRKSLLDIYLDDLNDLNEIPFFEITLPRELAINIFQFLDMKDLCSCASVSKSWQNLAEDNLLWRRSYIKYHREVISETPLLEECENWKLTVRQLIEQTNILERNWQEHKCQVTYFHHARGGVLTCTDSHDNVIAAGYTSGQVKLWDIVTQETETLESCDKSLVLISEDAEETQGFSQNYVTTIRIYSKHVVAGYHHGQIQLWNRDGISADRLRITQFTNSEVLDCHLTDHAVYAHTLNRRDGSSFIHVLNSNSVNLEQLDLIALRPANVTFTIPKVVMCQRRDETTSIVYITRYSLVIHSVTLHPYRSDNHVVNQTTVEEFYSTHFTQLHCSRRRILVGLTSKLGITAEYKVRCYATSDFRHEFDLRGHTSQITAIHEDEHSGILVTGCHDRRVRVYRPDISHSPIHTLQGHHGPITCIQADSKKVISGDTEGFLCVWSIRQAMKLWESQSRHSVCHIHFSAGWLIAANIPDFKYQLYDPENQPDEEHMTHIRFRGRIQACDFSKDQSTIGIPAICSSVYDSPEASKYNISLITPYDNI